MIKPIPHKRHPALILITRPLHHHIQRPIIIHIQPTRTLHIPHPLYRLPPFPVPYFERPIRTLSLPVSTPGQSLGTADILQHLDLGALSTAKADPGLRGRVDNGEQEIGEAVLVVVAGTEGEGDVFGVGGREEDGGCAVWGWEEGG